MNTKPLIFTPAKQLTRNTHIHPSSSSLPSQRRRRRNPPPDNYNTTTTIFPNMSKSSRFPLLPFSIGCNSHSSVQLAGDSPPAGDPPPDHRPKKTKPKTKKNKKRIPSKSPAAEPNERGGDEDEGRESSRMWSSAACCGGTTEKKKRRKPAAASDKPISAGAGAGVNKLVTTIKASISQLFVYRDEDDDEIEMEIGFPTDVKHVTHVGLDGNTTMDTNLLKDGWDYSLKPPPEIMSFPSISLKQFELAMAAQAHGHHHHMQLQPCE